MIFATDNQVKIWLLKRKVIVLGVSDCFKKWMFKSEGNSSD